MLQISIDEVIAKKVPSMSFGRYRDAQIVESKCPKCGSQIACVYDDLGATDYYDNYAHICLNPDCDFVLHHESFSCNMGGGRAGPESETCWFCNRPIRMTG
jgi:hypothetical protein